MVGNEHPCFIIAEAGVNHNGDISVARALIETASKAGADAVKFQTFKADSLLTLEAPKATYQIANSGESESQFQMIKRLELSAEMHLELQAYAKSLNITFLSSAFDTDSADFLNSIDVPAFKIPSGEITNLPLLSHIAKYGKPLIISTGMSTLDEVSEAVRCVQSSGCTEFVLLQCVSNYPALPEQVNLLAMKTMANAFNTIIGYSDHTLGVEIAYAATALGATIIEKHFTLDRNMPGPDHKASLEPHELEGMIKGIRSVESSLGHGRKEPSNDEIVVSNVVRKSIVSAINIPAKTLLTRNMLVLLRPGHGLPPNQMASIIGKTSKAQIPSGTLITWDMLD